MDRIFDSDHSVAFQTVPSRSEVRKALFETLRANDMADGVHMRLPLTRGEKVTSCISPNFNQSGCTLIHLSEWKPPVYDPGGVRFISSSIRRNSAQCIDIKIHHANLINNMLAQIEANVAGVDDALMLDNHGSVSKTNATNMLLVRGGKLLTPHADSCLPGITSATVIETARDAGITVTEKNLSITEVYTAAEMFTTGTMGGLSPVLSVDGRTIEDGTKGPRTGRPLSGRDG